MNPLTVLIVDDDPDMRLYLRSCLTSLGSKLGRVVEAADGLEALELARSEPVNLVICDVVLPRLDGRGVCHVIKHDPQLRHIPVVLISGEDVFPSAAEPADAFLAKPFNASMLQSIIGNIVAV